ncbi:hypothetical protein G6O69_21490 [Pseudenhygromyxa sp. WMMC2535]|uniref:hypothetical protein n=1 Tax=Pseudenhygromyxa sp. WMMC2535 TaxID=2712867 RepID=UPI001552D8BE|nr:hypothetical protein [Pseudenhygromyxa sp. WMMC2535]NVB40428.1 hypothetical protein [Pseudenhygromyxa sp. WMMC2535]
MSQRPQLRPIYRLLARVQRRERLAEALALIVRVALPAGLLLAAVAVISARALMTPMAWAWAASAPIPVVLAWAIFRPRSLRATARRVDGHYRLHDRLGNAIEFAEDEAAIPNEDPRTREIAELAIADGARAVDGLTAKPVIRLALPKPRVLDGLSLSLLLAALLLPQREPERLDHRILAQDSLPELETEGPRKGVDMTEAQANIKVLQGLEDSKEEAVARIAGEMLGVLEDLEKGEIDQATALERLDRLEQELAAAETDMEEQLEEDPWMLAEGMRELAEDLREHEIMDEVAEALAKSDAEEVEEELQKLMDKAEAEGGDLKKQLDDALAEMERSLARSAKENTGTEKAMEQAEREMKRQEKNPAEDPEEQEREMQRKKERLEELRRQHEREQKAREKLDQLQQLSRQSKGSSQSSGAKQKRQDAGKQLSKGASDATKKARQMKQLTEVRDSLDQAKQFVRRANQDSESKNRRKQQQQRFSKAAKGKKGKDGKPATMLVEGEVGDNPDGMMMGEGQEGQGEGEGDGQGEGQSQAMGQQPGAGVGPGIGEGSVEALGDPERTDVDVNNERVDAQQGKGQTRAEVIETASQEGFATESYKKVYRDYKSFAQSAMDSDELPEGQRTRVKRYFRMVQPQD